MGSAHASGRGRFKTPPGMKKQVPPLRRRFAPASVGMTILKEVWLRVGAVGARVEFEGGEGTVADYVVANFLDGRGDDGGGV